MPVHLAPCLREQMANQSPLGVLFLKTVQFQAKLFTAKFCKPQWQVPFWALISSGVRISVALETSQVLFAYMAMAPATAEPFMPNVLPCRTDCSRSISNTKNP
jgi:hypothetical protein